MDYTSIHIYGHLLSDDILHHIERENTLNGNRDQDFGQQTLTPTKFHLPCNGRS